jgi:hypothetical protein
MKGIAVASAAAAVLGATSSTMIPGVLAPGPQPKLDTPTITCAGSTQHTIFIKICAGASGAPAGFTLQWVKHSDYPGLVCGGSSASGWPSSTSNFCEASFSGVPGCSNYNLASGACVTVEVGNLLDSECGVSLTNCAANELQCGTEYVFRVFAHNVPGGLNASDKSKNLCCSTEDCVTGCVLTQGYWKTHACNWPSPFTPGALGTADATQCALSGSDPNSSCACDSVNTLKIGALDYTQCQLLCALARIGQGNALVILAHQLIAAKLNILNGADGTSVAATITDADALIDSYNILTDSVPTGGPGNTLGPAMTADATTLDLYNNGDGEVTHCP